MIKQVLIIEDEKVISEGLQNFFGSKGYEVYLADTLRHGLELLRVLRIEGVLLSLDMLEMTNFDVLNELRLQHPKIPVITMSLSPSRKLVLGAFSGGVKGHITKPIENEQLQEALFIFEGHLC